MKRALLIAGGTVGGLGAVLSITPPHLGGSSVSGLSGAAEATTDLSANVNQGSNSNSSGNSTATKAPSTTATKETPTKSTATSPSTKSANSTANSNSKSNSSSNSNSTSNNSNSSNSATTDNRAVTPEPNNVAPSGVTGTFTGDAFNVSYGIVQVKITVSNGKITDAVAVQAPYGRNQRFTDYAVPNLRQQTLAVQSAAIRGVSGASYTSYGWYKSLISALQKAGMNTGV